MTTQSYYVLTSALAILLSISASSPRKKLSLISEGDDQGTQQFGDAIRAGSTNVVQDFLLNNSLEILRLPVIIFDVTLRRLPNRRVSH